MMRDYSTAVDLHDEQLAAGSITAVMPVYNGRSFIEQSLPPLLDMRKRGDILEVVVVDDGSVDDTIRIAAEMGARVISTGGRHGPGAARNQAAAEAAGGILWFVDADVVVSTDAAQHVRRAFAEDDVVAVFGSYDDQPAATNFLSKYKNLLHHHHHQKGQRAASTFWAGCGAVLKKAFLAVGGFDTRRYTRPSIEDIELGYRLRAAGGRIILSPELQGKHLKVWKLFDLVATDICRRAIPWAHLLLTQGGLIDDLNVSTAERVRALIACAGLATLVASLLGFASWWLTAAALTVALGANLDLLLVFYRRNGIFFSLFAILWHQVYYLYSIASYAWCRSRTHLLDLKRQDTDVRQEATTMAKPRSAESGSEPGP